VSPTLRLRHSSQRSSSMTVALSVLCRSALVGLSRVCWDARSAIVVSSSVVVSVSVPSVFGCVVASSAAAFVGGASWGLRLAGRFLPRFLPSLCVCVGSAGVELVGVGAISAFPTCRTFRGGSWLLLFFVSAQRCFFPGGGVGGGLAPRVGWAGVCDGGVA
jgi:hypothetical protein